MSRRSLESALKSHEVNSFLIALEGSMADDLWNSAGGHWSVETIEEIKATARLKFAENFARAYSVDSAATRVSTDSQKSVQPCSEEEKLKILSKNAWVETVRGFHKEQHWGFHPLAAKEKLPLTVEQKIFRELFSYIWTFVQAVLIVKTAVLYYGIKSTDEDSGNAKYWVVGCILFSFCSLCFFAYRKGKKNNE